MHHDNVLGIFIAVLYIRCYTFYISAALYLIDLIIKDYE